MDATNDIKQQILENEQAIATLNEQLKRRTSEINIIQSISDEIINSLDLDKIFNRSMQLLDEVFGFKHSMILLKRENEDLLEVAACLGYEHQGIGAQVLYGQGTIGVVAKNKKILRMSGLKSRRMYAMSTQINSGNTNGNAVPDLPGLKDADSQIAIPLIVNQKLIGVYAVESPTLNAFKAIDEIILNLVATQIATAIDNATAYTTQKRLTEMYSRFVPQEFMGLMGTSSILDVKLADQAEKELTILFADIRDFTSHSEKLTPEATFTFINDFLGYIAPAIVQNNGFIDKYIGDAIMAIFPNKASDAVFAALEMNRKLEEFNAENAKRGIAPIRIGIGMHTGRSMVGIIGYQNRMESTVIGDAVNIASRIEGLTKEFQCTILASEATISECATMAAISADFLDTVSVKGKQEKVKVYRINCNRQA
jgi:adenylate cyclase